MKTTPVKLSLIVACTFLIFSQTWAQENNAAMDTRAIEFPDIPGYVTLKCDLHMHTVFSDGSLWPSVRVREALMDGLDAISITDHLEYQPKKKDIPHEDRNRGYELAREAAKESGLLVVPGAEITRGMPTGHFNAIFVKDANALNQKDVLTVFREAKNQGAIVFWNHPHWTAQKPNGVATLTEMHKKLLEEDLFAGIEVVNETTYSDEALELAQEHNLAIIGNSDVHGPIDWGWDVSRAKHRPVTLVFAKEKSLESMKEAMEDRRTAAWFDNTLVGEAQFLGPLVEQSLEVSRSSDGLVPRVVIHNHSDADFILENLSDYRLHNQAKVFIVKAHGRTPISVKTLEELESFELRFKVLNAFTSPDTHPEIRLKMD